MARLACSDICSAYLKGAGVVLGAVSESEECIGPASLTRLKPGSASTIAHLLVTSLLLSPCFWPHSVAYYTTYYARRQSLASGYAMVLLKTPQMLLAK